MYSNVVTAIDKILRSYYVSTIVAYVAPSFQDRYPSPTLLPVCPLVLAALWDSCAQRLVDVCMIMNVVGMEVLDWNCWSEKDELRDGGFVDNKVCGTGSGDRCMLKFKML